MEMPQKIYKKMMWRAMLTILIIGIALVGSLIYVAFYSTGLNIFQDIVVVIVALIIAVVIISILWMLWWMPYMDKNFNPEKWPRRKK